MRKSVYVLAVVVSALFVSSCKEEPVVPTNLDPIDLEFTEPDSSEKSGTSKPKYK